MKPSDHPEFFRLPPPEGRSRESSIVLDREGRFFHEGEPVQHPGMARAFASWIGRHPDDGRYILNNGYDWTYFEVEDAPFFVIALRGIVEPPAAHLEPVPEIELSDGSREPLDPARLRLGAGGALYVSVKDGAYQARFTRSAQLALAPLLLEDDAGNACIEIGGRRFPVASDGESADPPPSDR